MLCNVISCAAEPAAAYISNAFLGVQMLVSGCNIPDVRVFTHPKSHSHPLRSCHRFTYNHFYTHIPAQLNTQLDSKWLLHHRQL